MVYKPQMEPPDAETDELFREQTKDRIPDLEAVFSVHPPSGVLAPAQTMDFKATFAPPLVCSITSSSSDRVQAVRVSIIICYANFKNH